MVMPKCPNCKKIYRLLRSDDTEFYYMVKHDSPTCSYGHVAYHDLPEKAVKEVRESFKRNFPWKYKDTRKALS